MTTNPFGTTPPTIPTIASMGNAALIDDPEYPPIPTQQPTAAQMNLHDWCSAAAVMMVPFLRIRVNESGGTYTINDFQSLNPNIGIGDINLVKGATGSVTIIITSGKLPATTVKPRVWSSTLAALPWASQSGYSITILILGQFTDVALDAPFELEIWGHF